MSDAKRQKWERIYQNDAGATGRPCRVLAAHSHLLPPAGTALDLACGRGANALHLASHGLAVAAWDLAATATSELAQTAQRLGLAVAAEQRDVTAHPPPPNAFDVIVVSRFLDRSLAAAIRAALKERGLLFYQTFIRESATDRGPSNPAYRLEPNELLRLFQPLHVVYYNEEGAVGDTSRGFRDEAMLIAQRRGG